MTWQDITVFQFQELSRLWQEQSDKEGIDLMAETCAICYGMTEAQVDSLPMPDFNKLCAGLTFLNDMPQWEPVQQVTVNGKRYRMNYDIRELRAARYMEAKQYGQTGVVPNLHIIAASMVIPQKRNWMFGWVDDEYNAAYHGDYASDLQAAPITAIYGSALFFCKLFKISIEVLQDYLVQTIPENQRPKALQALQDSCRLLDGNTTLPSLLNMNESQLSKRIRSQLFNS